eukprot:TRINITY_DN45173_c0_g1_i1.p1 TRINITY_DN45173_c0_g1~~TRINITY_DN45173_c0_g1_i1.p1  ORF type:complete len:866 (-),score=244.80 TRINITY_DN45173_c0_g1_i1:440-3037(-)
MVWWAWCGPCFNREPTERNGDVLVRLVSPGDEALDRQKSDVEGPRRKTRSTGRSNSLRFVPGDFELILRPAVEKSTADRELIAAVLRSNENLHKQAPLEESHIQKLVDVAMREVVKVGHPIFSEGDISTETFYVVAEGRLSVIGSQPFEVGCKDGISFLKATNLIKVHVDENDEPSKVVMPKAHQMMRQVGPRTCLGETSMLYGTPRFASVVAEDRSIVWAISEANFKIVQNQAIEACKSDGQSPKKLPTDKSAEDAELLTEALYTNEALQSLTPMRLDHVKLLVDKAWKQDFEEQSKLWDHGCANAEAFYVVASGSFEVLGCRSSDVFKRSGNNPVFYKGSDGREQERRVLGKNAVLGFASMANCAPRISTATALQNAAVWRIDRSVYRTIQRKAADDHVRDRIQFLSGLGVVSNMPEGGKEALAGVLGINRSVKGDVLLEKGQLGHTCFILYEGEVSIEEDGQQARTVKVEHAEGSQCAYFGEHLLTSDKEPSKVTVKVISAVAGTLTLEQEDFKSTWGDLITAAPSVPFERLATAKGMLKQKVAMSDLQTAGLLGCGSLGPVELVKHKKTGDVYALKTVGKGLASQRGMRESLVKELQVSFMADLSPFILHVYTAFNMPYSVSFLMEVGLGGDLFHTYNRNRFWGKPDHARYYAASVALGLSHLHNIRVIFRNIKPTNIFIDRLGKCKIGDMSLAKLMVGRTFTSCGAPNYMAPEVVQGSGYTRAADWWSLGVLVYYLMAGVEPFSAETPMGIYSNVTTGVEVVSFPKALQGACEDFIRGLIKMKAHERLALLANGMDNVTEHAWYRGFSWPELRNESMKPPHKPGLINDTDLSHFHADREDLWEDVPYVKDDHDWEIEFDH